MVTAVTPYSPGALSEPGEWFQLSNISQADYVIDNNLITLALELKPLSKVPDVLF